MRYSALTIVGPLDSRSRALLYFPLFTRLEESELLTHG